MPADEAEADADWALSKQAAEPEGHKALLAGGKLGELSGASAMVRARLGERVIDGTARPGRLRSRAHSGPRTRSGSHRVSEGM